MSIRVSHSPGQLLLVQQLIRAKNTKRQIPILRPFVISSIDHTLAQCSVDISDPLISHDTSIGVSMQALVSSTPKYPVYSFEVPIAWAPFYTHCLTGIRACIDHEFLYDVIITHALTSTTTI